MEYLRFVLSLTNVGFGIIDNWLAKDEIKIIGNRVGLPRFPSIRVHFFCLLVNNCVSMKSNTIKSRRKLLRQFSDFIHKKNNIILWIEVSVL